MQKKLRQKIMLILLIILTAMLVVTPLAFATNKEIPNNYQNELYGFNFDYNGFTLDDSMEEIKTTFYNDNTTINIYYDDFHGTTANANSYIYYGNKSIVNGEYISMIKNTYLKWQGHKTHLLKWSRKPLKYVNNDFNQYINLDIIKNAKEVYTIYVRSKSEIDFQDMLKRFQIIKKNKNSVLKCIEFNNPLKKPINVTTQSFYKNNFINSSQLKWGVFEPSTIQDTVFLNHLERELNYEFPCLLHYYDLQGNFNHKNIQEIYDQNKYLEFTFQTSTYGQATDNSLFDVLDGKHDEVIDKLITEFKRIQKPVLFRLNNEMNGDWCEYNALHYQKDTRLYLALWQHFYNKLQENSVNNVIMVWNPNDGDFPHFKWNHYLNYFPGEKYVDIIGLTGYNTGNYYKDETWREFNQIYDNIMSEYKKHFYGYPYIITEFGSSIYGGDKQKWMQDMFQNMKKYDIKLAIWWNGVDYDNNGKPSRIYKFDFNPTLLETFKEGLSQY